MVVATDNPIDHYKHTQAIGLFDKTPQRFGPSGKLTALVQLETERISDFRSC